jgi:hypothetical protein
MAEHRVVASVVEGSNPFTHPNHPKLKIEATVYPGSVSALHVRAIETLPRHDRAGRSAQSPARAQDRHGQQRSARSECVSDSKVKLDRFVDSFISSCFIRVRKPDADIFRLTLDIVQASAPQVVYIENTPIFVQIAEGLGIRSILHTDYLSTCAKLASFGLHTDEGVIHETS